MGLDPKTAVGVGYDLGLAALRTPGFVHLTSPRKVYRIVFWAHPGRPAIPLSLVNENPLVPTKHATEEIGGPTHRHKSPCYRSRGSVPLSM